jgi:hypothetical protein
METRPYFKGFKDWVEEAPITDDVVGDFLDDAKSVLDLPENFSSQKELKSYLSWRPGGACREAIDAVPAVWRRYSAWRKSQ